jgi:hypothetical protein
MAGEVSLRSTGGIGSKALGRQPDQLADVLERVLDKGIVIVGDVVVNILDIELLSLKLRLFVSSAETAREEVEGGDEAEVTALRDRIAELEEIVREAGLDDRGQNQALPEGEQS